jgi:hypothetical protein
VVGRVKSRSCVWHRRRVGVLPFGRSRGGAVWRCRAPTLMYATSPWVGHLASCRLRCHLLRRQTMIAHSEPVAGGRNLVLCLDGTSNELGRNRTNVAGLNAVAGNCCADRSKGLWHKFRDRGAQCFDPNDDAVGVVAVARARRADEHTTPRPHQAASHHRRGSWR